MNEPTLAAIRETREQIAPFVVETPVWHWRGRELEEVIGDETAVFLKLELFQKSGTFKPRGALATMLKLSPEALTKGITAVSAGNHAIAVSYAAQILGTTAKVVMPKTANPLRIEISKAYGATVELVDNVHEAFARVRQIEQEEGRTFVHPFEGEQTVLGTATVGLELAETIADLDAVIVAIGGGGLAAGVATAVKMIQPNCTVYGVEPIGADSMSRSFASGKPEAIDAVRTIADSLGAPFAMPYSFGLCHKHIDEVVLVSDEEIRAGMRLLYHGVKLAVEPAGAAAVAALCGPLLPKCRGKRVGLIVCGANIALQSFAEQAQ